MKVTTRNRIASAKEQIAALYKELADLAQSEADRPELNLTLRKATHQLVLVELELEEIVSD